MKHKLLAKTKIKVSGVKVKVDIVRNNDGNIEIVISEKDMQKHFPNGTCTEGFNDEVILSKFNPSK